MFISVPTSKDLFICPSIDSRKKPGLQKLKKKFNVGIYNLPYLRGKKCA